MRKEYTRLQKELQTMEKKIEEEAVGVQEMLASRKSAYDHFVGNHDPSLGS